MLTVLKDPSEMRAYYEEYVAYLQNVDVDLNACFEEVSDALNA